MSSHLPLISVIIPAYNAEDFISYTLDSVLSQTHKNIEVLVVDDGSQDQTAKIVESIAQKDSRVILLQQQNTGVAAARNLAIQNSCGEYIAPIDADDIWFPQKLEKQIQVMLKADPCVGLVYAWSVYIDEEGSLSSRCQTSKVEGEVYIPILYGSPLGNASTPLIRRACIDRVGGYNCQLKEQNAQGCEDWYLYLRLAEYYEFRVVPELLIGYRQVIGGMSFNHRIMKKSCDLLLADAQQRYPEIPATIYRWSSSNFNWYLALRSKQSGEHWSSIRYLYKAASLDFLPLLRPGFYELLIKSFLKLVAKPITSLIWSNHNSWLQFQQKLFSHQVPEISDLNKMQIQKYQRFPRKQYNELLARRWLKIKEVSCSSQKIKPNTLNKKTLLYSPQK